jgi:hypothetical protein
MAVAGEDQRDRPRLSSSTRRDRESGVDGDACVDFIRGTWRENRLHIPHRHTCERPGGYKRLRTGARSLPECGEMVGHEKCRHASCHSEFPREYETSCLAIDDE